MKKSDSAIKIPNQGRKKGGFPIFTRHNSLYIGMPTTLGHKRGTKVCMGLADTPENRAKALAVSNTMYADLIGGTYIDDLQYYLSYEQAPIIDRRINKNSVVTVKAAWLTYEKEGFNEYKPTTLRYLNNTIYPVIKTVENYLLIQTEEIYNTIKDVTTPGTVVRVLSLLSRLVTNYYPYLKVNGHPYEGVLKRASKQIHKLITFSEAKAIGEDEWIYILQEAVKVDPVYGQLLRFMYLTGCRPSEAVGFKAECIKKEYIILGHSITRHNKEWVTVEGSKNNKLRKFPLTPTLESVLSSVTQRKNPWCLLFLTPRGKPIDLSNFSRRVWKTITSEYTLYNIRDTFITRQIDEGTPLEVIGKWCDTSGDVIRDRYLGDSMIHKPI